MSPVMLTLLVAVMVTPVLFWTVPLRPVIWPLTYTIVGATGFPDGSVCVIGTPVFGSSCVGTPCSVWLDVPEVTVVQPAGHASVGVVSTTIVVVVLPCLIV